MFTSIGRIRAIQNKTGAICVRALRCHHGNSHRCSGIDYYAYPLAYDLIRGRVIIETYNNNYFIDMPRSLRNDYRGLNM